ncbi:MAG: LPXTG cell wall anchor domain-containing protein [Oscillospiraceae bacterium]|nr:LPXTG cell wall anchor domain-containing protein [Oscillospiraceae bacterium]
MKRGINGLLLILAVLLCLPLGGSAHDVPEERKDCSIELLIRYDGEDITGGTLKAVKVGYVDQEDGNFFFYQEMTGEKLEDVASPEAAQKLKEFYDDNKDDYDFYTQIQTVTEGKSQFKNLTTGLYLIVQDNAAEGFSKLDAFLVGVPMMVEGEYQYHVTAAVKSELERTPTPVTPPAVKPSDPKLPQTGQLNWPVPLMASAGLGLFLLGWVLCFRKKRADHEK